jgi:hypothetical protein
MAQQWPCDAKLYEFERHESTLTAEHCRSEDRLTHQPN